MGGSVTVAAAVFAVLVVRELAVRVLHPNPAFAPLTVALPVVDTILCTVAASFVFIKNYVRSEPGPHMASSCDGSPNFVVYTRRIIGVVTQYGRKLERGLRSHGDARSGVGSLCNALTGTCYHEAPSESAGLGLGSPVDSVRLGAAYAPAF